MERDPSAFESFVAELNRRRVLRVVMIYVAVIFAVLRAADIVLPALGRLEDAIARAQEGLLIDPNDDRLNIEATGHGE